MFSLRGDRSATIVISETRRLTRKATPTLARFTLFFSFCCPNEPLPVNAGDQFLLCSDGLYDLVIEAKSENQPVRASRDGAIVR